MKEFVKLMYEVLEKTFNTCAGKYTGNLEALLYPPIKERLYIHQEISGGKYQIFAQGDMWRALR
ncbi:hypothetical protein [Bacteroides pyogenes]|uniref:hypothetical protein n=1 Tax=Bacteroides pyogenes TaxID=310300 RepID=UPI002FDADAB6